VPRLVLLLCACLVAGCAPREESLPRLDITEVLSGEEVEGYPRASAPRDFRFPEDHGAHPEFRNEWWYVTGNVEDISGRPFGFQVTFFRYNLAPGQVKRSSAWGTNQVWMAHLAVSDIVAGEHLADERLARGALGLAGVEQDPFRVWVEDWEMSGPPEFPWHIRASTKKFSIDLTIRPEKPVVLQGDQGLSRKSDVKGNASYYYSLTRLRTDGQVLIGGRTHRVTGTSWLDREWGTSVLASDQEGWDWFALQLEGRRELMFYRLRRRDGSTDPASRGILMDPDGASIKLSDVDVTVQPLQTWTGPGGDSWPVKWRLRVPDQEIDWIVSAAFEDQLVDLAFRYWEGSVRVQTFEGGAPVGYGYLEMTRDGGLRTGNPGP